MLYHITIAALTDLVNRDMFMLADRTVLLVEDEFFLADDLFRSLQSAGAKVVGPVGTLEAAFDRIEEQGVPDVAVLDINLRGTDAYPLVDRLIGDGVAVLLVTGYEPSVIPEHYRHLPRVLKPARAESVVPLLSRIAADRPNAVSEKDDGRGAVIHSASPG